MRLAACASCLILPLCPRRCHIRTQKTFWSKKWRVDRWKVRRPINKTPEQNYRKQQRSQQHAETKKRLLLKTLKQWPALRLTRRPTKVLFSSIFCSRVPDPCAQYVSYPGSALKRAQHHGTRLLGQDCGQLTATTVANHHMHPQGPKARRRGFLEEGSVWVSHGQ